MNSPYYGPVLESAGLGTPEEIEQLNSVEETLRRLPPLDPGPACIYSPDLLNQNRPAVRLHALFWPLPPAARTAVLAEGFQESSGVRVFRNVQRRQLERWLPDALAGPVSELRRLAEGVEDRGGILPPLTHSAIAFTILRQAFLSDEAREIFWRVFRVPVFGQILDLDGELLAWECEAHEGFHIECDHAVFELQAGQGEPDLLVTSLVGLRRPALRLATGLTGTLESSACGCGRSGPRLLEVRRKSLARAAVSSACAAD